MNKQKKKIITNFLKTFTEDNNIDSVEINIIYKVIPFEKIEEYNNKWLAINFVAPVNNNTRRNKDDDIKKKNYFAIDLDLREEERKKTGKIISDEKIIEIANELKDSFKWKFAKWRYIVFSGNGLHIYYTFNFLKIEKTTYKEEVKKIYQQFEKEYWYKVDFSAWHISRTMRLPETINWKRKERYWLKPKKCFILYKQDVKSEFLR